MNQYTNQSRQNRGKGSGSGYRHDSGRSEFKTVLLFYVLPFIIVNAIIFILVTATPKATVTLGDTTDYTTTTMELKVKSLLPIKAPQVSIDGTPVELTKTASKTYSATLNSNGVLEVNLYCINRTKNTSYEQINILDDTPPSIKDNIIEEHVLSFRLEDSQSGVDFSSIHAESSEDTNILPLSIDRSTGLITFDMPDDSLTVSAKDLIGNELRASFNAEGENTEENPEAADTTEETEENKGTKETEETKKDAETKAPTSKQ